MGPKRTPLAIRWRRLADVRGEDECWPWLGHTNPAGYGSIVIAGRNGPKTGAHRAALVVHGRDIPDGYQVDHLCKNTSCVNPAHLEAVPPAVNNLRSTSPSSKYAKRETCGKCGGPWSVYPGNGTRYCKPCVNAFNRAAYAARKQRMEADA